MAVRRSRRERGAALFIVVMVITLLTAIGVFSARAATLTNRSAGYARQAVQTTYVAEYATKTVAADITLRPDDVIGEVRDPQGVDTCQAVQNLTLTAAPTARIPCYRLFRSELDSRVDTNFAGQMLFSPYVAGAPPTPGSLGVSPLEGNFVVELTEPGRPGKPVAGTDVGGTGGTPFQFVQLTFTATGQTSTVTSSNLCEAQVAGVTGVQQMRAFVTVGPVAR